MSTLGAPPLKPSDTLQLSPTLDGKSGVQTTAAPAEAAQLAGTRREQPQEIHECRVLVVDDEAVNVRLLARILARAGFNDVRTITDSRTVAATFVEWSPDLVLLDLRMPHMDGFAVLETLRELIPADVYLPILMLTGDPSQDAREQALRLGARDFLLKPFDSTEVVLRIQNLLEARLLHLSLASQNHLLEERVRDRTMRLEAALRAAESASRAKSEFLASMSHELRTPLNSVIGFANVLLKNRSGSLPPQDVAYVQRILANGTHLLSLIDHVLDLSKVEAGKMDLHVTTVALDALVFETIEQLEVDAKGGAVVTRVDLPSPMLPIETDADRLRQVLINLVGNAVKFTASGSVVVSVRVSERGKPLRIDVTDTGCGIAPHRLAAIFESFEQEDAGTRRRYGGTGLGLSISRALCHLMGYRLTVASTVGVGSTFSVLLGDVRS